MCVIDANIPPETLKYICEQCEFEGIPLWYNPTDYYKCNKIVQTGCLSKLTYMSPNYKELLMIFKTAIYNDLTLSSSEKTRLLDLAEETNEREIGHLKDIFKYLLRFLPFIIMSRGEEDLILASQRALDLNSKNEMPRKNGNVLVHDAVFKPHLHLFPTIKLNSNETVINVNGAGDSASAGIIAGIIKGYSLVDSIYNGLLAAKYTLKTNKSVSDELNKIRKTEIDKIVKENLKNIKIIALN